MTSYEQSLAAYRDAVVKEVTWNPTSARNQRRWRMSERWSFVRERVAFALVFAAAIYFASLGTFAWSIPGYSKKPSGWLEEPRFAFQALGVLTAVFLLSSAFMSLRRALWPQLFALAFWWSSFCNADLIALWGPASGPYFSTVHAIGGGDLWLFILFGLPLATLLQPWRGFEQVQQKIPLATHRTHLIFAAILAVGDAHTLLLSTIMRGELFGIAAWPNALATAWMIIAVVGLLRMRGWGLAVNLLGNVTIAGAALTGALGLSARVGLLLCVTACAQLLLMLPLWLAIFRGSPQRSLQVPSRAVTIVLACASIFAFHRSSFGFMFFYFFSLRGLVASVAFAIGVFGSLAYACRHRNRQMLWRIRLLCVFVMAWTLYVNLSGRYGPQLDAWIDGSNPRSDSRNGWVRSGQTAKLAKHGRLTDVAQTSE